MLTAFPTDGLPGDARAGWANGSPPYKSRKVSPTRVTLTETPKAAIYGRDGVLIGSSLTDNAIRRSGLLSGIEATDGLATVPGHISPQEIQPWRSACSVDFDYHLDELVAVVKVRRCTGRGWRMLAPSVDQY